MSLKMAIPFLFLLFTAPSCFATDWLVHSGNVGVSCGSPTTVTLQAGINCAALGDTVTIDTGFNFTPSEIDLPALTGCVSNAGFTDRGWYSTATTYALNDEAIYKGFVYKSLQNANTNNQPDISPSFWSRWTVTTIRTASFASLPNRRILPTDASLLAKVTRTGASGVGHGLFYLAPGTNSGCWALQGLELTVDAVNQMTNSIVPWNDVGSAHLVVDRCFIHSAEFGTSRTAPYNSSSVLGGVTADGQDIAIVNSYIAGMWGLPLGATAGATEAQISAIITDGGPCRPCSFYNDFLNGGYSNIQMGGASQNGVVGGTINASPAPTTTTATLSSVTAITVGMPIALQIPWLGPCQGGDPAWSNAVTYNQWDHVCFSGDRFVSFQGGNLNHTPDITGANTTFWYSAQCKRTNSFTCYANGVVTNIAGSALTFSALQGESPQAVIESTGPPTSGGNAIWTGTQMGGIHIIGNYQVFSYNFRFWQEFTSGNGNHDKGYMENKNGDFVDVIDNVFGDYASAPAIPLDGGGWPSTFGFGNEQNQNGDSPFVSNSTLTVQTNWIRGFTVGSYMGPSLSGSYEGFLETPSTNILITQNFAENPDTLGITSTPAVAYQFSTAKVFTVTHNTFLTGYNTVPGNSMIYDPNPPSMFGSTFTPTTTFKDNLLGHGLNTVQCQSGHTPGTVLYIADCWGTGYTENHNIFVQCNTTLYCNGSAPDNPVADGGFANSTFVTNSGSGPWSGMTFVNPASHIFQLGVSSPGHNGASDGTDVGVNWTTLCTAMALFPDNPQPNGCGAPPPSNGCAVGSGAFIGSGSIICEDLTVKYSTPNPLTFTFTTPSTLNFTVAATPPVITNVIPFPLKGGTCVTPKSSRKNQSFICQPVLLTSSSTQCNCF